MNIDTKIITIKRNRKIEGYRGNFRDLWTSQTRASKQEAQADLLNMIESRSDFESSNVTVLVLRGYVGIFSRDLYGYMTTRFVPPGREDGAMGSSSFGKESMDKAIESFCYNISQLTWDGTLTPPDILPGNRQVEFASWCRFQLRYRYAVNTLGLADIAAHAYACDGRNPWTAATEQAA